jgi:hypothetical protein
MESLKHSKYREHFMAESAKISSELSKLSTGEPGSPEMLAAEGEAKKELQHLQRTSNQVKAVSAFINFVKQKS